MKALNNKLEEKSANVMHLFARQLIIAVLLVENATKHDHVTNEITKRLYLFDKGGHTPPPCLGQPPLF